MHRSITLLALALGVSLSAAASAQAPASHTGSFDQGVISGLGIRNIGSAAMSGRIAAVAGGHAKNGDTVFYIGSASGGLWKSTDGGTTFKPKFDKQPVQSIGSIALDPRDPDNVWVGTGEAWTRGSVSIGNGVYHSTDGGETWANVGLPQSERIVKLAVDPRDGNTVLACVTGKLWSDSAERGVYRTSNGGKSWTQVLKGGNGSTGCGGMSIDAKNPGVVFASLWDFRRKGWTFRSGGENADAPSGSGLYRSADGGRTWTEVTGGGLPAKPYGRIAVAVAPSDSKVVYAFVEAVKSALFRSDDGGKTWDRRDDSQMMVWRPFYFANLIVDPTNPDRLFKPDLRLIQSLDGGKTFADVGGGAHGDFHDVWIDPKDPQKVIAGDDGGLWLSKDGGNRWWKANNLPISQFYHVSVDNDDPYHVYGGLQDNSSWVGDSSYPGGITNSRWENMFGGDGFWMFPDPSDHKFIYAESQGGNIGRVNRITHEYRDIQPRANYKEKLRWNWNAPIALSPTDKDTLYIGSQFLFRSHDHGQTWDRISPDLTTNDPKKQLQEQSGGITVDNSAAEMHTTIYSISESPKDSKVIWVGTDDGNVQVTRDGGKSWKNVTAGAGVPANSWVSYVDAGRFDAGTAYVTFDRHTFGDMAPMLYKTTDYGSHWQALANAAQTKGIKGFAYVLREDPVRRGLLYAGTEFGLWISPDDGATWAQFKGGDFPAVSVRDLVVQPRDGDLVLATHGRGIWIIDDLTPLRSLTPAILQQDAVFLPTRPQQQRISTFGGWPEGDASYAGTSASTDATITYYQKARHLFGPLKLEVLDAQGKVIDTLPAGKRRGINRVAWSMSVKPPVVPPAASIAGSATQGPRVPPGTYTVRMTKGDRVIEEKVDVLLDPRSPFTVADRREQFAAVMKVHGMFGQMSDLVARIQAVRAGAGQAAAKLPEADPLHAQLLALSDKADTIRKQIVATKEGGAITGEERLREHMDQLYGGLMSYEGKPSATLVAYTGALERELGDVEADFGKLRDGDLATANAALKAKGMPEIELPDHAPLAWRYSGDPDTRAAQERD
ncbi:VPS10 domain-containing protein [Cognatiluteimonas profundi]|uniref:VPS10 domain-containing protein n=1 Tax=Cognatiluteimonas profundi TaxID=2594501 RepID=UPI00131B2B22|nr:sialidase [Lysobacter profundi]